MPRDVPEPIPSKFVIRKLPPELTEDAFKAILQNVCKEELEWFSYHPGSSGCGFRAVVSPFRHHAHALLSVAGRSFGNPRLSASHLQDFLVVFESYACGSGY